MTAHVEGEACRPDPERCRGPHVEQSHCADCLCLKLRHRFYAATSACECGRCAGYR